MMKMFADVVFVVLLLVVIQSGVESQPTIDSFEGETCSRSSEEECRILIAENDQLKVKLERQQLLAKTLQRQPVVVLPSGVELKAATSVSPFSCPKRNLSITVDDKLKIYIDGVEKTGLTKASIYNRPDVIDLPCITRSVAVHGINGNAGGRSGIVASTNDGYVLTNSSWKCSNVSELGWERIDFDDSAWPPAVEYGRNGNSRWQLIPGISSSAVWIWHADNFWVLNAFCRMKLDYIDPCDPNPCLNSGNCSDLGTGSFTCFSPIYATGLICESPKYNEVYACGTTLTWSQYDLANGFTRLCYFWTHMKDTEGRFNPCRNTIKGLPLYNDANGLLNAGGNFGCAVSQNYPEDIPASSYLACADNYQQYVYLGNATESDRLMVCIRYPYGGVPGRK